MHPRQQRASGGKFKSYLLAPNPRAVFCMSWLVFVVWAGSSAHAQRTIVNGGFEANNPQGAGAPSYQIFPNASVPGWSATTGSIELWDSTFNSVTSHSGAVHAEMNAYAPGALFQNVCLVNNETFSYSFAHRARSGGPATQVANFDIATTGGTILQTIASSSVVVADGWQVTSGTGVYTGATGVRRVQFTTTDPGSVGNFLDTISISFGASLHFASAATADVENGGTNLPRVVVSGTVPVGGAIVTVAVVGGTASAGDDFALTSTTITIPAGVYDGVSAGSFIAVPLTIVGDTFFESDETVQLQLSSPSNVRLGDPNCGTDILTTTHTITNDDAAAPALSILKVADDATLRAAGDVIVYTYTVRNTGNVVINGVTVADTHNASGPVPVPGSETLVTDLAPFGDSVDTGPPNGSWDTLGPGDTITFQGSYTVTQTDVDTLQ